jgi:hypothetical protein
LESLRGWKLGSGIMAHRSELGRDSMVLQYQQILRTTNR